MSYCSKCGTKLNADDVFCSSCGTKVEKISKEEYYVDSENLIERVKELLHDASVTRIIIKNEKDQVLLEIPAGIGVIGIIIAPWLAALGTIAAIATKCKIVVEKRESSETLIF